MRRSAERPLVELTQHFRVVLVQGPRQAGKTTLLRQFQERHGGSLVSLDEPDVLAAARSDPTSFVATGRPPLLIDEVQRGGNDLVLAVKAAVDRTDRPGQYVLAGSTDFLSTGLLTESLAGRHVSVAVWPLSVAERCGRLDAPDLTALESVAEPDRLSPWRRSDYLALALQGGFPEALRIPDHYRGLWFNQYLDAVIRRDLAEFARIRDVDAMSRLLGLLAARTGSAAVAADMARALNVSATTVANYLTYLRQVFLVLPLPAWSTSLTAKPGTTPRQYLADPGLAGMLLGVGRGTFDTAPPHPAIGPLVETLALGELTRTVANDPAAASLRFLRDRDGREIDVVLEYPDGRVVAIEIKASQTPRHDDAKHLRWLRDKAGDRFVRGYVLHLGQRTLSLGDRISAVPLSALWHHLSPDAVQSPGD